MKASRVLRKLRAGELVITAGVNRVAEPWLAEVIGRIGYDVIWFDMEHRPFNYDRLDAFSLACRHNNIDLMVRIVKSGYTSSMRALEFGANGIMVPHCRSIDEVKEWVEWTRFPPLGRRGFDGAGADADYGMSDPMAYIRHAGNEVFLAIQIEDREAVDCANEIAAIQGVDLLFVGPADLSLSYGVPFEFDHPLLQGAVRKVAAAAAKAGKWWGIPTDTPAEVRSALGLGARFVTAGGDHLILVDGFRCAFEQFHRIATA